MAIDVNQLLRDIKAAVMINRSEAVNLAMDGLLLLPDVISNERINSNFIARVVNPLGEILSALPPVQLRQLAVHELAVGRAIGAIALTYRFVRNNEAITSDLTKLASDSREEVRTAIGKSLANQTEDAPERILELGKQWIQKPSPRIRTTALIFLPKLTPYFEEQIKNLLFPLGKDTDRHVRVELAAALGQIARTTSPESVLELLSAWSKDQDPNIWVICRALSESWAAQCPEEVEPILKEIRTKTQETRQITNTVKALRRHGLEVNLQ